MRIGAVVVNFNGLADTRACLASLRSCGIKDLRIIVIDNASTDGSAEALKQETDAQRIANDRNLGFGAAVNQGSAPRSRPAAGGH